MRDAYEMSSLDEYTTKAQPWKTEVMKQRIFSLSMCKNELETELKSLTAWNQYGNGGQGVALQIEFDSSNKDNWLNYQLSGVKYNEADKNVAKNLFQKYLDF